MLQVILQFYFDARMSELLVSNLWQGLRSVENVRKHHCGAKLRISATSRNCRDFRFILYSITIIIEGKARRLQPVEYRRVSLHHRVFDPRSGRRPQQIDACGSSLFFFFFFSALLLFPLGNAFWSAPCGNYLLIFPRNTT